MRGDGDLGDIRPGGTEVLHAAGSTVYPRGDPRLDDCVSVMVALTTLPELDADYGYGTRSFTFLVAGGSDVGARGSDGIRLTGTSCRRMATTLFRRAYGLLYSSWSPDTNTSKFVS